MICVNMYACVECPTVAGRGRGGRGVHLWSRKADEGRRRIRKWRKRRHRSTDLWSACSLPGGERRGRQRGRINSSIGLKSWLELFLRIDNSQRSESILIQSSHKRFENTNRKVICCWLQNVWLWLSQSEPHSLCTLTLSPAGGSQSSTDPDRRVEKHKQDVSETVHMLVYSVWIICIICRTDLVVDEELWGHRQEAKSIHSWEEEEESVESIQPISGQYQIKVIRKTVKNSMNCIEKKSYRWTCFTAK